MPRIQVLTWGSLGQACFLAINAALSFKWAQQPVDSNGNVINPNLSLGQGALASYYLFNGLNSFTYTPLQSVYPSENLETTTRAKGLALSGVISGLVGFINTYAGPIGLGNIKNNYVSICPLPFVDFAEPFAGVGVRRRGRCLGYAMVVHRCGDTRAHIGRAGMGVLSELSSLRESSHRSRRTEGRSPRCRYVTARLLLPFPY